jgi:poly(A) polymerase
MSRSSFREPVNPPPAPDVKAAHRAIASGHGLDTGGAAGKIVASSLTDQDGTLLLRYGTSRDGTLRKKAQIYTREEHGIDSELVDADALWVIRQLRRAGFHAYLVGGAVRDLLLGRVPNDFDVATDAHPQKIKRVFRSARIIGRRFRIVHVYLSREKYIEVTTFRARGSAEHENTFGTMEEDAARRDFTFNALYYCPVDQQLIDYVEGFPDIRKRLVRTLIPAEESFIEDPVRMIRMVKYAILTGFPIPAAIGSLVRRHGDSLLACSRERVTEEVYKILASGAAADILELAHRLRLFDILFPALAVAIRASRKKFAETGLAERLRALDAATREGRPLVRDSMFGFLFRDLVLEREDLLMDPDPGTLVQRYIRSVSEPLFPSKKELVVAMESLLNEAGWQPPAPPETRERAPGDAHRGRRKRRRRRRGPPRALPA